MNCIELCGYSFASRVLKLYNEIRQLWKPISLVIFKKIIKTIIWILITSIITVMSIALTFMQNQKMWSSSLMLHQLKRNRGCNSCKKCTVHLWLLIKPYFFHYTFKNFMCNLHKKQYCNFTTKWHKLCCKFIS